MNIHSQVFKCMCILKKRCICVNLKLTWPILFVLLYYTNCTSIFSWKNAGYQFEIQHRSSLYKDKEENEFGMYFLSDDTKFLIIPPPPARPPFLTEKYEYFISPQIELYLYPFFQNIFPSIFIEIISAIGFYRLFICDVKY